MTPDRRQRVLDLFGKVVTLDKAERSAFLRAECGDHIELLQEVGLMLAGEPSKDVLDDRPDTRLPASAEGWIGKTLSHYKIL